MPRGFPKRIWGDNVPPEAIARAAAAAAAKLESRMASAAAAAAASAASVPASATHAIGTAEIAAESQPLQQQPQPPQQNLSQGFCLHGRLFWGEGDSKLAFRGVWGASAPVTADDSSSEGSAVRMPPPPLITSGSFDYTWRAPAEGIPWASAWAGTFEVPALSSRGLCQLPDDFALDLPRPAQPATGTATGLADEGTGSGRSVVAVTGVGRSRVGAYMLRGAYSEATGELAFIRVYMAPGRVRGPRAPRRPREPRPADLERRQSSRVAAAAVAGSSSSVDDTSADEGAAEKVRRGSIVAPVGGKKRARQAALSAAAVTPAELATGHFADADVDVASGAGSLGGAGGGSVRARRSPATVVAAGAPRVARLGASAGPLAGCLYEGDLGAAGTPHAGLPHGMGTVVYPNGCMYEGALVSGRESGRGILSDGDDVILYQGEFADGAFAGSGTFFFGNGDRYAGAWRDGLPHGRGTYTAAGGASYIGEWAEGLRHGTGTMVGADGRSSFAGTWVAGRREGRGELSTAAGFKFRGSWLADKPDGKGEATYPDGARFDGSFRAGRREGRGTYEWPASGGQTFMGHFVADAIDAAAPGTVLMHKTAPTGAGSWLIPVAVGDLAKVHVKAGFDRSGQ